MPIWELLLVLGLVSRQTSIAKKAVVHLNPPWTTIFSGEKVTLTCQGFSSSKPGKIWWYNNQQVHTNWSTDSIEINHAGGYRCQTQNSDLSDPVNLVVSSDSLILQTPYSVFEGDTLVLKCRGKHEGIIIKYMTYYKDESELSDFSKNSDLSISIPQIHLNDSGKYHCKRSIKYIESFWREKSEKVELQIQELFAPPELKVTTSEPTEGSPMTLSCETQIPPQRSDTELHFSFFRDGRIILSDRKFQQLQIPAVWSKDSGSYYCKAKAVTKNIQKQSNQVMISVKKIPISGILLDIQPSGGQVPKGKKLVLNCSIAQGIGNITFSWHKEGIDAILGEKTQHSLQAKFVLSSLNESDTGKYYCTASNGIDKISSLRVNVTVKIRSPKNMAITGITIALISIFILTIVSLVVYFKFLRKSERRSFLSLYRASPISNVQELVYSNSSTQKELVPIYDNGNSIIKHIVYSELQSTQEGKVINVTPVVGDVVYAEVFLNEQGKEANNTKNPSENKDPSVIYTEIRIEEKAKAAERSQDAAENYENVKFF
ncbi:Fc receptor-like protein 4 isoform X2 [Macrotis lagotis]|uniref:Fc receptor-like protein 4 isoform X2 n=1 Tax=Macrotis lagotis TaxID=92651 RepID=UPI003D68E7A5